MILNIIGGTYYETCREPFWDELYGSGLRAAHALSEKPSKVVFHTNIGKVDYDKLVCISEAIGITTKAKLIPYTNTFAYDHPLAEPYFDRIEVNDEEIIYADLIVQFGMIEGNKKVKAKKAIYDPQSPGNPQSFWSNGSDTQELIWVANIGEMEIFTGAVSLKGIKEYLFSVENVVAAVIKKGTDGAIIIQRDKDDFHVPVFKTKHVWPIGTGDIFTASFAYNYLIENHSIEESAINASLATAYYTETKSLPLPQLIDESKFERFYKESKVKPKIYLAGPFFNMAQRWMIEQFRVQLRNFGLDVFSPYHDVGLGNATQVVPLDIEAIKNCDIVLAIVDGLDAGTLFEIGFAKSLNLPVVVFVEDEKSEALTMLKGTNCLFEKDFSTVIYKTVWESYKV
ncbi:PfkB family carbohydrate kinase [Mucilaginibacter dorajii]|uniref:Carbohydrate kinase PfkB domain-containing protein n=1 Tax=Mucilaginibacter dorajii TaxID=692994 RepID=A0ABP7PN83_9SPHI|nr:PfkB family carbohydrate kinase [Mucilaginibacter dorajii]MCS3733720.1 nucleoside 2-deoxyribosyltransferase [Mucilaginibacter dorajii]